MKLNCRIENNVAIVKIEESRLDAAKAPSFKESIADTAAAGYDHLILDVSELRFVDSSGLSALIWLSKLMGPGSLSISSPSRFVQSLLRITRIDQVLRVVATPVEAMPSPSDAATLIAS